MLTLFTIIGISFVLYANSAATMALTDKESQNIFRPEMQPEECMSFFLNQLIYDVRDDASGVYSSMRGHSLSRNMYGFNYNLSNPAVTTTLTAAGATSVATTITVQGGANKFPLAPPSFCIQVDNEYMTVTAASGTTWTVVRGSYGTTATVHAGGAQVSLPAITQTATTTLRTGVTSVTATTVTAKNASEFPTRRPFPF